MRVLGATLNQRVPGSVIKVGKRKYDRLYYKMNRDQILEKAKIQRQQRHDIKEAKSIGNNPGTEFKGDVTKGLNDSDI
jgi:hypothetical protein